MICTACGAESPAGSKFCVKCGTRAVESVDAAPAPAAVEAPAPAPPPPPEDDDDDVEFGAEAVVDPPPREITRRSIRGEQLRTIPGTIGGAVRMNAGCYGSYVADHFLEARAVNRRGDTVTLTPAELDFGYRHSALPDGWILTEVLFEAPAGDPAALAARMAEQLAKRDETQPVKDRTAGSTFRNPAGYSSTGAADDSHELKAWKLIDDAGLRGATMGGAQMNPKHPNFLTNTGGATAAELEALGEDVRKRVFQNSGVTLQWEIRRVGDPIV